ncbi:MAG: fibronectin type III domain-containing protein [Nitrospirae bacterium]|nr:fibronectin type III domain-containing protein [Nitrospirota bacterium]
MVNLTRPIWVTAQRHIVGAAARISPNSIIPVNTTPGGTTYYGNDCSGFVSISWKLPKRYNTDAFDCDAINKPTNCNQYNAAADNYVTKLGERGDVGRVALLPGDAVNDGGSHIMLFESYPSSGLGINVIEQTRPRARRWFHRWDQLASYRPIRRSNIDERNYEFVTKWGSQGDQNGQFNYPTGIAIASSGNVYVADEWNYRIQEFTNNGNSIAKWGSSPDCYIELGLCAPLCGQSRFDPAEDVAVDQFGNIYALALDCNNSSLTYHYAYVQKFDSNGTFLTWWDSMMDPSGGGWSFTPDGISIDSNGNVYLVDSYTSLVRKFTSNGSLLAQWGSPGSGNGKFNSPTGISVDSFGNVYIADTNNHRIQKFSSSGTFLTSWGSCCICDDCPGIFFNSPMGIAVDTSGNVYVADTYNHRIQKSDGNGNLLTKWGTYGFPYGQDQQNGNFQYPKGVAVDSSLNVFVADTDNNRIQKFKPVSPYPGRPTNLTATAVSSNQINLSWTDTSNNETGFNIVRKQGIRGGYSVIKWDWPPNSTTFTDVVPTADTYYYAVYAKNGTTLYSAYSNEASATITVQGAPAAPSNLTINAVTSNQIVFSWADNSTDETGFKIERKTGSGGTYSQIALVGSNTTSYPDSGLTENTTYYYRVKASNAGGDSSYSNEVSATTLPAGSNSISGTISGLGGRIATVTLTGAASLTTSTDASGNYVFSGLANGTYAVTPALAGYTFVPIVRRVIVNGANVANQNFLGTGGDSSAFMISGTVSGNGSPLSGVIVNMSGSLIKSTSTNSSGNYQFSGIRNGTYRLTPNKTGYTFYPATRSVTVSGGDVPNQNFGASP